uniref:Uncharacterized protein n=1 Tax=Anguilla anguilla TaxID=7936 RepID=A0A0E9RKU0_ANGAN
MCRLWQIWDKRFFHSNIPVFGCWPRGNTRDSLVAFFVQNLLFQISYPLSQIHKFTKCIQMVQNSWVFVRYI